MAAHECYISLQRFRDLKEYSTDNYIYKKICDMATFKKWVMPAPDIYIFFTLSVGEN